MHPPARGFRTKRLAYSYVVFVSCLNPLLLRLQPRSQEKRLKDVYTWCHFCALITSGRQCRFGQKSLEIPGTSSPKRDCSAKGSSLPLSYFIFCVTFVSLRPFVALCFPLFLCCCCCHCCQMSLFKRVRLCVYHNFDCSSIICRFRYATLSRRAFFWCVCVFYNIIYRTWLLVSLQTMKAWTDSGDIVGAKGSVKRTDKGELSVYVNSWSMLSKSVLPLPDKFHGLKDTEKRYRQVSSSSSSPFLLMLFIYFSCMP